MHRGFKNFLEEAALFLPLSALAMTAFGHAGNALCGDIPGNMSVYNCNYNDSTCTAVQKAFPGNLSMCSGQMLPHSLRSSAPPGVQTT